MNTFRALLYCSLIVGILCDCYRESSGCKDPQRKRSYRLNQKWKPKSNPCYTCKCIRTKVTALRCKMVSMQPVLAKKKNESPSTLGILSNTQTEEFVRISPKQAKTKKCPPIPAPTFNWVTGHVEKINYKTVIYFYYKKEARCCSRFITFSSFHPSCKVVKVGKCRTKVVKKSNPKKSCNMPMSLVG